MSDPSDLDVAELARAAGVSTRTVRYYVREKLLAPPGTRGPGARYGRSALDRLRLIKLLQKDNWPLAKIREKLEQLDDDGVRAALGDPPELPLSDTALSYVHKVMGKTRPAMHEGEADFNDLFASPSAPIPPAAAAMSMSRALRPASPEPPRWEIRKSTWERIKLSPNVELSVRRPITAEESNKVDTLIDLARRLFE